jgi:hypothetical protein
MLQLLQLDRSHQDSSSITMWRQTFNNGRLTHHVHYQRNRVQKYGTNACTKHERERRRKNGLIRENESRMEANSEQPVVEILMNEL